MNHELFEPALTQPWQPEVWDRAGSPDLRLPVELWRQSGYMTVLYQLAPDDMAYASAPFRPGPTTRFIEHPDGPQDSRRPALKVLMSAPFPARTLYYFPTVTHLGRNLAQAIQSLHALTRQRMIVGVGLEPRDRARPDDACYQPERRELFFYSAQERPWWERDGEHEDSAWQEGALTMLALLESKRFADASMRRQRVIDQARAEGKPIGAPPKLTLSQAEQAQVRLEAGESRQQIARELGVSERTLTRAVKRLHQTS